MSELFLPRDLPRYECLEKRAQRYPDLDAGSVQTTLVLMRVASDLFEAYSEHLCHHGLSQGRFMVLMMLDRHQDRELLPSELADKLGVTRATVTGLLDGLEKEEWVERRQHRDDRRALTVHLTARGRAFLESVLPDHYRRISHLMGGLDKGEREELMRLLSKVGSNLSALRHENDEKNDKE